MPAGCVSVQVWPTSWSSPLSTEYEELVRTSKHNNLIYRKTLLTSLQEVIGSNGSCCFNRNGGQGGNRKPIILIDLNAYKVNLNAYLNGDFLQDGASKGRFGMIWD